MKIAVAGTGYVGLSMATLLAQHHNVVAVDVIKEKVEKINRRESPIQDEYIEKFFAERELDLVATLDGAKAYREAEIVIIAAPTNYDPQRNFFDTHHIEDVIDLVLEYPKPEDDSPRKEGRVETMEFLYDDIYEEGLVRRKHHSRDDKYGGIGIHH